MRRRDTLSLLIMMRTIQDHVQITIDMIPQHKHLYVQWSGDFLLLKGFPQIHWYIHYIFFLHLLYIIFPQHLMKSSVFWPFYKTLSISSNLSTCKKKSLSHELCTFMQPVLNASSLSDYHYVKVLHAGLNFHIVLLGFIEIMWRCITAGKEREKWAPEVDAEIPNE